MFDKFFDAFHVFIIICLIFDNCVMQAKIKNLQNDVLSLFNKIDNMDNMYRWVDNLDARMQVMEEENNNDR